VGFQVFGVYKHKYNGKYNNKYNGKVNMPAGYNFHATKVVKKTALPYFKIHLAK
jgi:hypothetical protein